MAEKISMLIVVVDLDCHKCYHKIRKILCQLQDHERIRTVSFDTKSKTVTIVGPFDPLRLACKLRCKGGKVVRDVHIIDTNTINDGGGGKPPPENMPVDGPPPPAPVKKGKNKNKEKQPPPAEQRPPSPPPPESAPPPGPPSEQMMPLLPSSPVYHNPPPSPDRGTSAMVPQPHYVEEKQPRAELEPPMSPPPQHMKPPPMDMPAPQPQYHPPPPPAMKERHPRMMMPAGCPGRPLEQQQPVAEYVIPTVEIPSWPATPVGPCGCPCCAPCYQGYYDSCRCGCCGRVCGTTVRPLPPACGGYRGCRTFSDDDPSAACSIM